jgi:hypothetical protein
MRFFIMPEKPLKQLAAALDEGKMSLVEYETAIEIRREANRAKQRKYQMSDARMRLLRVAVPKDIMEGLDRLEAGSGVMKQTLVELALAQFLSARGITFPVNV